MSVNNPKFGIFDKDAEGIRYLFRLDPSHDPRLSAYPSKAMVERRMVFVTPPHRRQSVEQITTKCSTGCMKTVATAVAESVLLPAGNITISVRSPRAKVLAKAPTGIGGFKEIIGGQLPRSRTTLPVAGPGPGKAIFALKFLVRGAQYCKKPDRQGASRASDRQSK